MPSKALLLDIVERLVILGAYSQFVIRLLTQGMGPLNIGSILIVMSESIPLFFILIRRFSTQVSRHPFDWSIAILGTVMPLLISQTATHASLLPQVLCNAIIVLGLCVQIAAKVSLGRSYGIVPANRGVESTGPYRFVRHPMYLGYTMTHIGFVCLMPSPLTAFLYAITFSLQIVRVLREERVLNEDPVYREFASQVRYRLVPGIF
ncbi:MAG: isoprenylcysteine carboxylmethyltransferase family protein [Rhizomicrobium sp.]